jgi:hypothetical protein
MHFSDGFQIQRLKRTVPITNDPENVGQYSCHSMRRRTSFPTDISTNGETAANSATTHASKSLVNFVNAEPIDFQVDWVASDILAFTEYLENEVLTFSDSRFDSKDLGRKVRWRLRVLLFDDYFILNFHSEQGIDEALAFAEEKLSRGTLLEFSNQWSLQLYVDTGCPLFFSFFSNDGY